MASLFTNCKQRWKIEIIDFERGKRVFKGKFRVYLWGHRDIFTRSGYKFVKGGPK